MTARYLTEDTEVEYLIEARGGIQILVHEFGRRTADASLLVFHGGPDMGHRPMVPGLNELARSRHVVAFDFRGTGESSRALPPADLTPELVLDDAWTIIEDLGLAHVDLLGFATGGPLACAFLQRHPHVVRRLVLASTSAFEPGSGSSILSRWPEVKRRHQLDMMAGTADRSAHMAVWNLRTLQDYLRLTNGLDAGDWARAEVARRPELWCPTDPIDIINEWAGPTLVVHGQYDMGFPLELAIAFERAVPNSKLSIITDAGHMAQFEKPYAWSQAIAEFLASS